MSGIWRPYIEAARASFQAILILLRVLPKLSPGGWRIVLPAVGSHLVALWEVSVAALLFNAARVLVWWGEPGAALRLVAAAYGITAFWRGVFPLKGGPARPPSRDC